MSLNLYRPSMIHSEDSACNIPRLPNELLVMIFRYLAAPYEIESHNLTSKWWRSVASRQAEDRHRKELKKLAGGWSFGFVCKTWFTLHVPFIYEWVTIYRHKHLAQLSKILRHPPRFGSGTHFNNVGWYTKRLDIAFEDGKTQPKRVLNALVDIIKQLPNLEVLTIATSSNFEYYKMDPRILEAVSPKLKVINWLNNLGYLPEEEDWCSFLKSHPYLVAANLPPQRSHWKSPDIRSVVAPSLEHYCVYLGSHQCDLLGPMPSLKRLTILDPWPNLPPEVVDSLMQYKSTLTSIQFNFGCLSNVEGVTWLLPLFHNSPHLHRVDLVFAKWTTGYLPQWCFPPSITEIGVRVVERDSLFEAVMLQFFMWLNRVSRGNGTEPARIHFLDDFNVRQVMAWCHVLISYRQMIFTSWKMPSGDVFDLLSLEDVEEVQRKAAEEIKEMGFRLGWGRAR